MAIKFYLEINGKRTMLPVNPPDISVGVSGNNVSVSVLNLGEITQLGKKALRSVSFNCFFPKDKDRSYVLDKGNMKKPDEYVSLIEKAMSSEKPIRLIITDTKLNLLVSIESFPWSIDDSTGDITYSLELKEYKQYGAKFVKKVNKKVSEKPKCPTVTNKITIGCTVVVNGRLHRDSYGSGPGQTEVNATRKVNFIQKGKSHPYHVTLTNGGWRGWVTAGSVRRIK